MYQHVTTFNNQFFFFFLSQNIQQIENNHEQDRLLHNMEGWWWGLWWWWVIQGEGQNPTFVGWLRKSWATLPLLHRGSGFLSCLWADGCPKERTVLSAAPRSASLIPVENTDSVNFMNCRAFGETWEFKQSQDRWWKHVVKPPQIAF